MNSNKLAKVEQTKTVEHIKGNRLEQKSPNHNREHKRLGSADMQDTSQSETKQQKVKNEGHKRFGELAT